MMSFTRYADPIESSPIEFSIFDFFKPKESGVSANKVRVAIISMIFDLIFDYSCSILR